jgi:hypothetical protein
VLGNVKELGFHLCYGDFGASHFIEQRDMGMMVEVANALAREVRHSIAYIHMPAPSARSDDDYFRPLQQLALSPSTESFLGLVRASDGAEGTRWRIEVARKYIKAFGIATECGMARPDLPHDRRSVASLCGDLAKSRSSRALCGSDSPR